MTSDQFTLCIYPYSKKCDSLTRKVKYKVPLDMKICRYYLSRKVIKFLFMILTDVRWNLNI